MPPQTPPPAPVSHGLKRTLMGLGAIALVIFSINQISSTYTTFHPITTNYMTVTGEGKQKAVPDLAQITLGITTVAATADAAQKDSNTKINKIIDFLKTQGIQSKD